MSEGAPNDVIKTGEQSLKTIEINGVILEMGPCLGWLEWKDMNERVTDLNKTLAVGERPWRILAKDEYEELTKPIMAIWGEKGISDDEKETKICEYVKGLGFVPDRAYWSSTESVGDKDLAWVWDNYYGEGDFHDKDGRDGTLYVQCVR